MRIRRRSRGSLMIAVCLCASHGSLSPDAMHPAEPKPSSRSRFYDPDFRRREVAYRATPVRHEREEVARVRRVPQLDVKYGGRVSKFS